MYTIYALIDPRNDTTRYIGLTDNVYARFKQHVNGEDTNIHKVRWIRELKEQEQMLIMRRLEVTTTLSEARDREQYWIRKYMNEGTVLLNMQNIHTFTYEDFLAKFNSSFKKTDVSRTPPIKRLTKKRGKQSLILMRKVEKLRNKYPNMTYEEIGRRIGRSKTTVATIMKRLAEQNTIAKDA